MKSNTFFAVVMMFSVATGIVCSQRQDKADGRPYRGWGFEVLLPDAVTAKSSTPVEDFELYDFRMSDRSILKAYAGNHSNFGKDAPPDATRSAPTIGPVAADRLDWHDSEGRLHVEVRLTFNRSLEFPQQLHFKFDGLSNEEKEIAERIITSARSLPAP